MTNEEIIKLAQADASNEGEAEIYAYRKAVMLGSVVCTLICISTLLIKYFKDKFDYIELAIMFLFIGTNNLYYGKKCNSKKNFISGIVEIIFGLIFYGLFLGVIFI